MHICTVVRSRILRQTFLSNDLNIPKLYRYRSWSTRDFSFSLAFPRLCLETLVQKAPPSLPRSLPDQIVQKSWSFFFFWIFLLNLELPLLHWNSCRDSETRRMTWETSQFFPVYSSLTNMNQDDKGRTVSIYPSFHPLLKARGDQKPSYMATFPHCRPI